MYDFKIYLPINIHVHNMCCLIRELTDSDYWSALTVSLPRMEVANFSQCNCIDWSKFNLLTNVINDSNEEKIKLIVSSTIDKDLSFNTLN